MTRRTILEYAQAILTRHMKATKEEKGKILDEFTKVTSLHRKAAIRLLKRIKHPRTGAARATPRIWSRGS